MADRTVSVRLEAIVDTYNQRMSSAATATEGVGRAGDTAGRKIGAALEQAGRTAGQMTLVAAGAGTALLTSALKTGTAYNTLEQTSRAAFKTVLGSAEAAAEMMEKVAAFAKTSPFPRQAFIEGTQQLLAFGMEADRVIPTLSAIQDAMAAAGKGSQEIGEVVNIFAQVQSTGKITAETLNQLGTRGVDAATLLGEAFGVSAQEIRSQVSAGTLDAGVALETLTAQMTETFGGAAEGVKDTWVGAVDRVKGAWRDISSIIADPFVTKTGGGLALDWVNGIADAMRDAEKHVTPMMEILTGRLAPAFDLVSNSIQGVRDRVQAWDIADFTKGLDGLAKYAAPIGGVTAALLAMGTNLPILSTLGIAGVNPLVAGLAAMVALSPELRGVAKELVDGLRPAAPAFKDLAKQAGDTANVILSALAPAAGVLVSELAPLAPVIAQTATAMLGTLQSGVETLAPSLTRLVEAVAPVVASLGSTVLQSAAQGFSDVVTQVAPQVARLVDAVAPLAGLLGANLVSAVGATVGALSPLASVVATLVGAVADLPTPILAAATAFTLLKVGPLSGLVTMLGGALVGAVGAARTAVSTMTTSMAASQGVAAAMGTQVSRVGALALSARAGVSSLRTAMVAAFITNPVGIAIAGISAALGVFVSKQNDARARTEAYSEAVKLMAGEMDGAAKRVAANAFISGEGLDWGWFQKLNSGYGDFMELAGDLDLTLTDLASAVTMTSDEFEVWAAMVKAAAVANGVKGAAADELITKVRQQRGALDDATEAEKASTEAQKVGAEATGVNTDKIKAQTDAVNANNDAIIAAAELFISAREAGRRYAEAVKTVSEKIIENNAVLADGNATEEDRAAALRSSNDELDKLATASLRALDRNREQGASTAELTQQTSDLREALIWQAEQMGMTGEEAAAYVDKLGLIPGEYVATAVFDDEVARQSAEELKQALTDAGENLDAWEISADGTSALKTGTNTKMEIDNTTGEITIDGDERLAIASAARAKREVDGTEGTIKVNAAPSSEFAAQVNTIKNSIPALFGFASVPISLTAAGGKGKASHQANGSLLEFYANGGMRESHVAQIAPAGAMRVWAEPETGGEAYIPLAESKRSRSVDIWRETGRRLGQPVQEFAAGGIVGLWQQRLKNAQYWVGQAKGWGDDAAVKRAEDRAREAEAALKSLKSERDALTRSTRRGEVVNQATSGLSGAYSVVNQVWDAAKDDRFTKSQRDNLWKTAAQAEPAMKRLYGQAEKLEKSIANAKDKAQELSQIKAGVSSVLSGEFTLGGMLGQKDQFGYDKPVTSKTLVAGARSKASQIKAFAGKLDRLRKMGLSGTVLEEVARLGTEEGTQVADALIAGGKGDIASLNSAYKSIESWSDKSGQFVTEGFYKGGVQAAEGLVRGLESQQKAVEKQILKVAQGMERALKKALGIKSPSRVFRDLMNPVGDGTVLGLADQESKVGRAAAKYGEYLTPAISSPSLAGPSWLSPGMSPATANQNAPAFDVASLVQAVRQGVASSRFVAEVNVGSRAASDITRTGVQEMARTDRRVLQKAVNG